MNPPPARVQRHPRCVQACVVRAPAERSSVTQAGDDARCPPTCRLQIAALSCRTPLNRAPKQHEAISVVTQSVESARPRNIAARPDERTETVAGQGVWQKARLAFRQGVMCSGAETLPRLAGGDFRADFFPCRRDRVDNGRTTLAIGAESHQVRQGPDIQSWSGGGRCPAPAAAAGGLVGIRDRNPRAMHRDVENARGVVGARRSDRSNIACASALRASIVERLLLLLLLLLRCWSVHTRTRPPLGRTAAAAAQPPQSVQRLTSRAAAEARGASTQVSWSRRLAGVDHRRTSTNATRVSPPAAPIPRYRR